jgi:hypothetical protein
MGFEHNRLSHEAEEIMLAQIRSGAAGWATDRLTKKTTRWQGMADWPKPDFAFADASTRASLAVEFKPPGQPKREYVTALGQTITYLQDFEYSAIILPRHTEDRFPIAEYLQSCLEAPHSRSLPVALFAYTKSITAPGDLAPLVELRPRPDPLDRLPTGVGRKVFWSYWRDLSNFDALEILRLLAYRRHPDFDAAYLDFWRRSMAKGRALTWEARHRRRKSLRARSYSAERLNTRLSLQHIGLIDRSGRPTDDGFRILRTGEVYGADSAAFLDAIAQRVLTSGHHLDLIFWIADKQVSIPAKHKGNARAFYIALDKCLQKEGIITEVPDGTGKPTFLRDEQKLWNKLNLLKKHGKKAYFHPRTGLVFDWRNIISAVQNTVAL